ncbi:MAG TPA: YbaY family lipoprotein [Dyella sp.]|uniref:YbaY family lipoprotein n=1 Tax=Dyella sp. TaxID=1869338 RepID=UPI002C4B0C0B|nr:YbaY family lipoprotein [Dyella sp.]HUB91599.1 YbaY family lipoprotein [Dyella sp.]
MKVRYGVLLAGAYALAGCSWMPHFGKHEAPPPQQALMKSLTGEVDYHLMHDLPPDAYLIVTLNRHDAPAGVIATDRIAPIGPSPVPFVLSYEPGDIANGTDFRVSASIKQGDRTLATTDTQTRVLGDSGNNGPISVVISELH